MFQTTNQVVTMVYLHTKLGDLCWVNLDKSSSTMVGTMVYLPLYELLVSWDYELPN